MNQDFWAEQRSVRRSRAILSRRYLVRELIITVVVLAIVAGLGFQLFRAHQQRNALQRQIRVNRVDLSDQKNKGRALKLNVRQLHSHKYVDQLLSKRFYDSKPGQTVYSLPGDVARDVTSN